MAIYYRDKLLENLVFDKDNKLFSLSNSKNDFFINIPFVPQLEDEEYNPTDYYVFLFENNHLNAENDVFQLFDKDRNERIGWIFPITTLESNNNDFAENIHLNKYKLVSYKILLSKYFSFNTRLDTINTDLSLSNIYGDDTIICTLSKEKINNNEFDIFSYYPSLASYGYFEKNDNKLTVKYPNSFLVDNFRGNEKLKIKKANNSIIQLDFTKKLYDNYLKTLDHHLIRFHLLYQIIEFLITENFSTEFDNLLQRYNKGDFTKNTFLEKINEIRSERKNIRNIFDNLTFNPETIEKKIKIDIERTIKDFLRNFNLDEKEHIGDLIYDTRNIITHNYREIKDENIELLKEISYFFEILINYVIIKSP